MSGDSTSTGSEALAGSLVYRNYQPFHPDGHVFGVHARTGVPHGDKLERTVDVAERLSHRDVWHVENDTRLDFRYLDREIVLTRANRSAQDPGTGLRVDLLLANTGDRSPGSERSSTADGRLRRMSARVAVGASAVALLGVVLLAACAGSDGGEIEATGEIAFANTVGEKNAIYVVDAQGRSRRRITRPWVGHVRAVEWSPAGRRIAYAGFDADVQGGDRLFVVNADGTGWRRPLTDGGDDWTLAWSSDGSTLAFDRNADGPNWIYVVQPDRGGERRVSRLFGPPYDYHPAWSPDGRIAYVTTRGVWVMDGDGLRKQLLVWARIAIDGYPTRSPVAWSPDGRRVAFTTGTALWVMTADGSGQRRVSAACPPGRPGLVAGQHAHCVHVWWRHLRGRGRHGRRPEPDRQQPDQGRMADLVSRWKGDRVRQQPGRRLRHLRHGRRRRQRAQRQPHGGRGLEPDLVPAAMKAARTIK